MLFFIIAKVFHGKVVMPHKNYIDDNISKIPLSDYEAITTSQG